MPIPDYQILMRPVLEHAQMGEFRTGEFVEILSDKLGLSAEEREEKVPSGRTTVISSRLSWARTYLKHAGLLESPRRGHFVITERGKAALADPEACIDNAFLKRYDEFRDFQKRSNNHNANVKEISSPQASITPEEALRAAYRQINDSLAADLLDRVRKSSPSTFESLLVKLFVAMRYGGTTEKPGHTLGRSGDDGVDGVINQDPLGVDQIYLQAKRYKQGNNIGSGAIRDFYGALDLQGATKGIFVTTSAFSKAATDTARQLGKTIVLIDGEKLSDLMLRYNIGCRDMEVMHIKRVDEDYFEQLI